MPEPNIIKGGVIKAMIRARRLKLRRLLLRRENSPAKRGGGGGVKMILRARLLCKKRRGVLGLHFKNKSCSQRIRGGHLREMPTGY